MTETAPHHDSSDSRLGLAFGLTVVILIVEAAAGYAAHSLALLSDAGHIFTDVVALGLALVAVVQSRRPADMRRSFGYYRVGVLAAMANGVTLILVVIWIAFEAINRLQHPQHVEGALVIAAALVAMGVNTFIALRLRHVAPNLNIRAALLHVTGDLAASAGVVVAGLVILLTGWAPIDPLLSLGIAVLVAWGALRIVLETVNVLLEATPKDIDVAEITAEIESTDLVDSVHDLHVWSLSPDRVALSCHLVLPEQSLADSEHLVQGLEDRLRRNFWVAHTTIQVEQCHPCAPGGQNCEGFEVPLRYTAPSAQR